MAFPMQHLFPLPAWCERRLTERADDGYGNPILAHLPLAVPEGMRTPLVACTMILTERALWLVGPKGVVVGGELLLKNADGLYERHTYGYDRSWIGSEYFRLMVGLDPEVAAV